MKSVDNLRCDVYVESPKLSEEDRKAYEVSLNACFEEHRKARLKVE